MHGVALMNLNRLGYDTLKLELQPKWLSYASPEKISGKFYTNHPIGFFIPTLIAYKIFGVSEATTRLGPLVLTLIAIICLYFALTCPQRPGGGSATREPRRGEAVVAADRLNTKASRHRYLRRKLRALSY